MIIHKRRLLPNFQESFDNRLIDEPPNVLQVSSMLSQLQPALHSEPQPIPQQEVI